MVTGQKEGKVLGLDNILLQIPRNISLNSSARLSNLSFLSMGFEAEGNEENSELDIILRKQKLLIETRIRTWIIRRRYKKLVQKAKYRLKVISELVSTEENYVQKLQLLMSKVYTPLLLQCMQAEELKDNPEYQALPQQLLQHLQEVQIKKQDVENIFSNLESIIEVNSKFSASMQARRKELNIFEEFADICVQYAPHLKIYVAYLNNYEKSTKTLESLQANNPNFKKFCIYMENYQLDGLDLSDFLIKPVQRLPKYILLLKDILKNTDKNHRDYKNVQTALNDFNEVCSHNNEQMDKYIRDNKLTELHRKFCQPFKKPVEIQGNSNRSENNQNSSQFGSNSSSNTPQNQQTSIMNRFSLNPFQNFGKAFNRASSNQNANHLDANANGELQLLENGVYREFLWEETLYLFQNDSQRQVIVYFLSDVILVSTKENLEKEFLLKYLKLNEASFYKNMSDLKYFSNLFRISGKNESLTFICESDESKNQLINRINKQILIPLKLKVQQKVVKKQEMLLQQQQQKQDQIKQRNSNETDQSVNSIIVYNSNDNNNSSGVSQQLSQSNNSNNQPTYEITQQDDIQFPIQVTVLGTEERVSSNKLKEKYTVYICEIQIGEKIKQKIFVRYSEMIDLKEFVQKNIKEITGFEDLPRNLYTLFTHHKTKVIEKRKILIENFLQKILSHQGMQNHPLCSQLLSILGLPTNFYLLPLNLGESNFDFLNNLDDDASSNNARISNNNENYDESENKDDSFSYEKGFDDDRYQKDHYRSTSQGNNGQQPRQISVGASKFLNQKKFKIKQQIQNNCDTPATQVSYQEDCENSRNSGNKINDILDFSIISIQSSQNQGNKIIGQNNNQSYMNSSNYSLPDKSTNFSNSINQSQIYNLSLNQSQFGEEKEIEILTLDNKFYKMNINKYTKAFDICENLSKRLGLVNFLDFRLYLEDEKKNIRFLDDDEPIFKLIFKEEFKRGELEMKNIDKDSNSVKMQNLKKSFLYKIGLKHNYKYKLKFCKYIWLQNELEEFDYKSDLIRLQLMAYQVLDNISQIKFFFDKRNYFLYCALYLFINHPDIIQPSLAENTSKAIRSNIYSKIKEFLHPVILKQNKENIWVLNTLIFVKSIYLGMLPLNSSQQSPENLSDALNNFKIEYQKSQITNDLNDGSTNQQNKQQEQLDQDITSLPPVFKKNLQLGTGHLQQINENILAIKKNIAFMTLLDTFKMDPFYGATLFYCETYKKTIKDAKQQNLIIPSNIIISIQCDLIGILDPSNKNTSIKSFKFKDIKETKVFPSSITFIPSNHDDPIAYRFDTQQSFEISQLMVAYSNIMIDIKKDTITLDEESAK